jgi:hypothetical protein
MNKESNEWFIEEENDLEIDFKPMPMKVVINDTKYYMTEDMAGLTHALLLLVDAINDK